MPDDFATRLRQLISEFGSRYALARSSGIAQSTLQSYETGSKPGMEALVRLAQVGNVDLNWLLNGMGEMRRPGVLPGAVFADILMVDQYERGTALSMQVVIGQVPFSRDSLKKLGLTEPTHKTLLVIEAGWDLYRIARGDLVLIDRSQATFPPDDVYLLDFPGMELRGLFACPGDKVNVAGPRHQGLQRSQQIGSGRTRGNSSWPTMNRSELLGIGRNAVSKVVGRAVWIGRNLALDRTQSGKSSLM
jgi:transcriptional regulator with XRE-family HTH domain